MRFSVDPMYVVPTAYQTYSDNDAEPDPATHARNHATFERVKTFDSSGMTTKDKENYRNQKNSSKISTHFVHLKPQTAKTEEAKDFRIVDKQEGTGLPAPYDGIQESRRIPEWEVPTGPSPLVPWPDEGWNQLYPDNKMSNSIRQEMMLMEVLQEKVRANRTDDYRGFHNNLMEMLGKSEFKTYDQFLFSL